MSVAQLVEHRSVATIITIPVVCFQSVTARSFGAILVIWWDLSAVWVRIGYEHEFFSQLTMDTPPSFPSVGVFLRGCRGRESHAEST